MSVRRKDPVPQPAPESRLKAVLRAGQTASPYANDETTDTSSHGLKLVYARIRYDNEYSWAILDKNGKTMYPGVIMGDVWTVTKDNILQTYPLERGDKRVENLLKDFFTGWKDVGYSMHITEALQELGYTVP